MSLHARIFAPALLASLVGCASLGGERPDFAARNRPLEERCVRAQPAQSISKPGLTREEVQAEARAAAGRGELDKACNWL